MMIPTNNNLLVSASTLFYTFCILTVVYFWWANRQFHFQKRRKDGSRLSMVATHKDAVHQLNAWKKKRGGGDDGCDHDDDDGDGNDDKEAEEDSSSTGTTLEDDDEQEEEEDAAADLSDYDTETDSEAEEEALEETAAAEEDATNEEQEEKRNKTKTKSKSNSNVDIIKTVPPEMRQNARDLTAVVANMEVFSYLSSEAFVQCLEFMQYIDLPKDDILFTAENYDGSLYAVVSGQVKCQFECYTHNTHNITHNNTPKTTPESQDQDQDQDNMEEQDQDNMEEEPFISFTASDGDVVTSLLSMLAGLVRQCQVRSNTCTQEEDSFSYKTSHHNLTHIVPPGVALMAIGEAPVTKIVRVPPSCFLAMLDTFPKDVHRIAQTIVTRMQRVTLQTLVRCLGLQKEMVRNSTSSANKHTSSKQISTEEIMAQQPQVWHRLKAALSNYFPKHPTSTTPIHKQDQLHHDAAIVTALNLMGHYHYHSNDTTIGSNKQLESPLLQTVIRTIQNVGQIVSLPPSQTLIEMGSSPDAIYFILQGTLDVGMHSPQSSTTTTDLKPPTNQSRRRASLIHHPTTTATHRNYRNNTRITTSRNTQLSSSRRSIFPHQQKQNQKQNSTRTDTTNADKSTPTGSTHTNTASTPTSSSQDKTQQFSRIYQAFVGEVVGALSCFTGDASIVTIRNASHYESAILYKIPKDAYDTLLAEQPSALTECLGRILDRLAGSPIVCLLDWNVEWMHVQAGEDVVHRGDDCDALYAVLNGRLRAAVPTASTSTSTLSGSGASNNNNSKTNIQPPTLPSRQSISERNSSTDTTSFLSRARLRLKNRPFRFRYNRNNPKVASAPPPLSRRMMNSAGEEVQGEEFGRGAIIGEVEILTGTSWANDVYASRHSELARVPVSVLNAIIRMRPRASLHLARVVASQIQRKDARKKLKSNGNLFTVVSDPRGEDEMNSTRHTSSATSTATRTATSIQGPGQGPSPAQPPPLPEGAIAARRILPSYGLTVATIAVVPLLEDGDFGTDDLDSFCQTLADTLHSNLAPTKLLTKGYAREKLGEEVFAQRNAMHILKMTRLCGDLEENYRLVVYQAESKYTWWTRLCIQQADCILLVVRAEKAPPDKKVEACLSWAFAALNVKIQLVVLQSPSIYKDSENNGDLDDDADDMVYETVESSDQLNDWSEQRYWIAGHHLVRTPFKKHIYDFRRLCRRVTGRSIGVVLGGGGARGLAHIGVIQALMEAGITVDFVGGTSQGAFIGALYAASPDDFEALVKSARQMADTMSNNWEKLRDLTLPLVSFFSGYRFNRGIQKSFGRRRIQDLVCNFFCVSTDIRNNVQVVHTKGLCWRYVRASMTLQNYLPPLSEDGALLVDGGYMNVLPADVMKLQMRARTVIAVDVSQEVILDNYEYGSHLNGWWILWNSWNPFTKTVNIPSMGDISERLAWVSGERHKKRVREHIDLFLQPPVGNYGVLEYDKFDEIVQLGYTYAKPRVDNFVKKYPHLVS